MSKLSRLCNQWPLFPACLAAALAVYFFPFFFEGRHFIPFHFEPSQATGIPEGGVRKTIYTRFPGHDNSPILIHYPNASFTGQSLRKGELPLWNPHVGCGTPALGSGQSYPFSPFLWPFYAFPTPWVYSLGLLLGCAWSALGAYLWLGRFGWPSWQRTAGALFWVFNPYTLHILLFSNVWAFWWFGWLLWSWDWCLSKDRCRWWLPSLFITGMVYCGHPEDSLLLAAASLLYSCLSWAFQEADQRLRLWIISLRMAAIAALAGALTAIHTLPVLARLKDVLSYKFADPERVTASYYQLFELFKPRGEVYLSPVMMGLAVLGLVGLARGGKRNRLWPVLGVLALGALLCFRPSGTGPLIQLLTLGGLIPGIYARAVFWCGIVALVTSGAGRLVEDGEKPWPLVRQLLLGLSAFLGLCWAAYFDGNMIFLLLRPDLMLLYAACSSLILAAILLPSGVARSVAATLALAMAVLLPVVEVAPKLRYYGTFNALDPLAGGPPALSALRDASKTDPHKRFAAKMSTTWHAPDLSPNLASVWQARDVRLVDALVERRFASLHWDMLPEKPPHLATWFGFKDVGLRELGLLGVGYYAYPEDLALARFRWESLPHSLPRAFLVNRVRTARNEEDSRRCWKEFYPTPEVYSEAVIEGWEGSEEVGTPDPSDRVEWLEDSASRIRLTVRTRSGGLLVLLDTYAKGWKALLDGTPARIYPANLAFRAVRVPPGTHEVVFRYRPCSVVAGGVLAVVGWLIVAGLALFGNSRRGTR